MMLRLAAVLLACAALGAAEEDDNDFQLAERQRAAADFRVERAAMVIPREEQRESSERLTELRAIAANLGQARGKAWKAIYQPAWNAYRNNPYTSSAPGHLDLFIRSCLGLGKIARAANSLEELWLRYPEYSEVGPLLSHCLEAAEQLQNAAGVINLRAETPDQVIDVDAEFDVYGADLLFTFLASQGDYHTVAPRAMLGQARSQLIRGNLYGGKTQLEQARATYVDFFQRFPESELLFQALCEHALAHLLGFNGDRFDGGALENASLSIDQAELYTQGLPERIALVTQYRQLVTRWRQAKEAAVARWYEDRDRYVSALYYYRLALGQDRSSRLAPELERAIARVEPLAAREP